MDKTTIQIHVETLDRLKALKSTERQSYDDVLNNLIDNSDEDMLSEREIEEIQRGLEDVKKGKVRSLADVAKDLGITLK